MLQISDITLSKLEASDYIVPLKMGYNQADVPKTWDLIQSHHSSSLAEGVRFFLNSFWTQWLDDDPVHGFFGTIGVSYCSERASTKKYWSGAGPDGNFVKKWINIGGESREEDLAGFFEHGVVIIIYNSTRNALICVKQFRPAVYFNSVPIEDRVSEICTEKYPPRLGLTLEFCAGIVDKDKSLAEIAVEEVLEECGYRITKKDLMQVKSYRNAVGVAGDVSTLFYAEVTDDMKVSEGGGIENELIEVFYLSLHEAKMILTDEKKSAEYNVSGEFLFGLTWFLNKMAHRK